MRTNTEGESVSELRMDKLFSLQVRNPMVFETLLTLTLEQSLSCAKGTTMFYVKELAD